MAAWREVARVAWAASAWDGVGDVAGNLADGVAAVLDQVGGAGRGVVGKVAWDYVIGGVAHRAAGLPDQIGGIAGGVMGQVGRTRNRLIRHTSDMVKKIASA